MQPHEGVILCGAFGVALVEDELPLVVQGIRDGVRDELVELCVVNDVVVVIEEGRELREAFSKMCYKTKLATT